MRDPSFLDRNNIEILRRSKQGTEHIDPTSVDWDDEEELKQLLFRQRPGPGNALGHVKFLFPNPFHVYLHDMPSAFIRRCTPATRWRSRSKKRFPYTSTHGRTCTVTMRSSGRTEPFL